MNKDKDKESENKRGRYSDAQRQATNRYRQKGAQVVIYLTKEQKEMIQQAATDAGQSVNQFILDKVLKGL